MEDFRAKYKGFNRETIKFITIILMTMNHYAWLFLKPGTVVYSLFTGLGYATAISMCFFLVEGFYYTGSRKKYALRLAVFGLISQLPFVMVHSRGARYWMFHFNMLISLFLCFLLLLILENVKEDNIRLFLCFAVFLMSLYCDWDLRAPAFTLFFYQAHGDKKAVRTAFFKGIALHMFLQIFYYVRYMPPLKVAVNTFYDITGPLLSMTLILLFYNGKEGRGSRLSKWFFYVYYPAHLLILILCYKAGIR